MQIFGCAAGEAVVSVRMAMDSVTISTGSSSLMVLASVVKVVTAAVVPVSLDACNNQIIFIRISLHDGKLLDTRRTF